VVAVQRAGRVCVMGRGACAVMLAIRECAEGWWRGNTLTSQEGQKVTNHAPAYRPSSAMRERAVWCRGNSPPQPQQPSSSEMPKVRNGGVIQDGGMWRVAMPVLPAAPQGVGRKVRCYSRVCVEPSGQHRVG